MVTGTAGLSDFFGNDPVMATHMTQGFGIARFLPERVALIADRLMILQYYGIGQSAGADSARATIDGYRRKCP
jgi:hypothetical protein